MIDMLAIREFLHMGGYAAYVWSAYGLCTVILILNVVQPLYRYRKTIRNLANREHKLKARKK
jgi:heme exporter protein D